MDNPNDLPNVPEPIQEKDKGQPNPSVPKKEEELSDYDRQMLERFKNPKDTLTHFKEIQGFATGLSQKNKSLEEEIARLKQENEDLQYGQLPASQTPHANYQPPQQEYETPEQYIDRIVGERVMTERMKEVLEDERAKNPKEFGMRYGVLQQLASGNPTYAAMTHTPTGVRQLFKKADDEIAKQYKTAALKAIQDIPDDLPPEDAEKVRVKLSKLLGQEIKPSATPSGYMPPTTGATRTEPQPPDLDAEIAEATSKGDVDKVTELLFQKQLNI